MRDPALFVELVETPCGSPSSVQDTKSARRIRLAPTFTPNARASPLVTFGPERLAAADFVVVLVDHTEFDPATIADHAHMVFDTKNLTRGHAFSGEVP